MTVIDWSKLHSNNLRQLTDLFPAHRIVNATFVEMFAWSVPVGATSELNAAPHVDGAQRKQVNTTLVSGLVSGLDLVLFLGSQLRHLVSGLVLVLVLVWFWSGSGSGSGLVSVVPASPSCL